MSDNVLHLVLFDTSLGWMGVIGSSKGLKKIILPKRTKEEVLSQIKGNRYRVIENDLAAFGDLPQRLRRYLGGELIDFSDSLDLEKTTVFQQKVWRITQTIPYGKTRSYAWVSSRLGYSGRAARAVGQALGKNPLPIVIPCHRVIGTDGCLGGFSAGLALKKFLLRLESEH